MPTLTDASRRVAMDEADFQFKVLARLDGFQSNVTDIMGKFQSQVNVRLDANDKRIDGIETRMGGLETMVGEIREKVINGADGEDGPTAVEVVDEIARRLAR